MDEAMRWDEVREGGREREKGRERDRVPNHTAGEQHEKVDHIENDGRLGYSSTE